MLQKKIETEVVDATERDEERVEVEPSDADADFQRFSASKAIAGHPSYP